MDSSSDQRFQGSRPVLHVVFAFFAVFSLFLTYHHVPWRDEAQAWLMARSLSIWGLFLQARHEGHPILWYLGLKALQTVGIGYPGMMVLNWVFVTSAIWLLFYRSPFSLIAKIIVALSPICLLHLSFNARNYAISVALTFLAAALYPRAAKKPMAFCIVLALLANTNVFAATAFIGMSFQFMLEQGYALGETSFSARPLYTRYLAANVILGVGGLLLFAQLVPVPLPTEVITAGTWPPPSLTHFTRPAVLILGCCAALVFFTKAPGCPRIYGGIPSAALALIPIIELKVLPRHSFIMVAEVIYFVWIYYNDLARMGIGGTFFRIPRTVVINTLVILATLACSKVGIEDTFKKDSDSTPAAEAIIQENLDQPNTLFFCTNPTFASALLLQFQNIRSEYGPPIYPPGPMLFPDSYYTRKTIKTPSLQELKPQILDLAEKNPGKTILLCGLLGDPGFDSTDTNLRLKPIYTSPTTGNWVDRAERFQIYVLER